MSESPLMQTISEAVASGANVVAAIRQAMGYSVEDLAVTCGLAVDEIVGLEAGADVSADKLRRIAHALRLPDTALTS